jgi:hypothetical protein
MPWTAGGRLAFCLALASVRGTFGFSGGLETWVIVVVVACGQLFGLGGLRVEIFERGVTMVYHLAKYNERCKRSSYFAFVGGWVKKVFVLCAVRCRTRRRRE